MDEKKVQKGCVIGCFGFIVLIGILIFVFLLSIFTGEEEEEEDKAFDFTVVEYESTLREKVAASSTGTFLEMGAMSVTEETGYYIPMTSSENIAAFIFKNDEGEIFEIEMVATGNAFLVYNKEVLLSLEMLVKSVDPTISVPQLYSLFENLGINGNGSMLDDSGSYALNGISYMYIGSVENDKLYLMAKPE